MKYHFVTFTTLLSSTAPTVTTQAVSKIAQTSATGNGSQTVTVNKVAGSVTPNAANKTYGDADPGPDWLTHWFPAWG